MESCELPREPSQLADVLIQLMDDTPSDWTVGEHRAEHTPSGLSMWIYNGAFNLHIGAPFKLKFGWWKRRKLWQAVQRLKVAVAMTKIKQT